MASVRKHGPAVRFGWSGPGTGGVGGIGGVPGRLQDRVVGDQNRYPIRPVCGVSVAANWIFV